MNETRRIDRPAAGLAVLVRLRHGSGWSASVRKILIVAVFILTSATASPQVPRPGTVQLSDGEILAGQLSLTPGESLKILQNGTYRSIGWERVREIQFRPVNERLEQKWRFPEAGQTRKEKWGQPYPVRELEASVRIGGGQEITGHLFTTVLYVATGERTHKIVLARKQRGKEGERLAALVYPVRISFADAPAETAGGIRLKFAARDLVALTHGVLARVESRRVETGEFELPATFGENLFLAAETKDGLLVGWPGQTDPGLQQLVTAALADVRDFLDQQRVLGVYRAGDDVYSAMMLRRCGPTSLNEARSQPWRLEIWRWKYDAESRKLMLAGRGWFFRGILSPQEQPPPVQLSEELWKLAQPNAADRLGDR